MAAMVSMSNLLNGKDSRWLQLEVCREFQRNKCSRPDTECKFAHPPSNVEVQNGRVTACYDSIKGRCNREKPPCKYFHPPQHLKDQLLINGRNHLALKNALMQQMGMPSSTPAPTILPSPLQPMTANRFLPASAPFNPYFGAGLLPMQLGPDQVASAMAGNPLAQTMSLSSNAAAHQQKRNDRVQMDQMKFMSPYYEQFTIPGLIPQSYKRPAPDYKGYPVYHPSAAAYQQLMQLQTQQPNLTSQLNSINQSTPNKAIPSSNIDNAAPPDAALANAADAEAKLNVSGSDECVVSCAETCHGETGKTIHDSSATNDDLCSSLDDATKTSIHSVIEENNLNANSFISATSSSSAATLAAIYTTTSSIANNNNSILPRKNSLASPSQHIFNASKPAIIQPNTTSSKVESVPDYLSASSINNHSQNALLSAMLYNQPYSQLALTQNLYSDPAQMAKEFAQKSYANVMKYAAAQQNPSMPAKGPLNTLSYPGVALSASNNAMYAQQPCTSASRLSMTQATRSPFLSNFSRPMPNPFQQFIRPQMPVNLTPQTNPYYAAAAAAQQQMINQQNLYYSGMTNPMTSQQLTSTSSSPSTPSSYGSSYPYAFSQAQTMNAQGLSASMMQMPQMTPQQSQTGSNSSVVLNPYKKMKTS